MVKSMTGFGRCETTINGRDIIVEIKSVNHRYFEFSCRTTRGYSFLEDKLKTYINQKVARGKVDMFVSVSSGEDTEVQVTVNHSLAAGYVTALRELQTAYNLADDISVSSVARYNDIFTIHKTPEDEDQIWSEVVQAADVALGNFVSMREAEGEQLKNDVMSRCANILSIVEKIEQQAPQTLIDYEARLKERIYEMLAGANYDEQRVLTEVAVFADKVAVAEETVRLRSHFDQFSSIINAQGPIGRKLDFIIQEMNRETNTIGSKVQDAALAHMVVEIKSEIEKIREQIQNIE